MGSTAGPVARSLGAGLSSSSAIGAALTNVADDLAFGGGRAPVPSVAVPVDARAGTLTPLVLPVDHVVGHLGSSRRAP